MIWRSDSVSTSIAIQRMRRRILPKVLKKLPKGLPKVTQDTEKTTQDTTQVRLESEMREIIFYKMKQQNIIKRVGTSQKGYWEILIEDNIWRN